LAFIAIKIGVHGESVTHACECDLVFMQGRFGLFDAAWLEQLGATQDCASYTDIAHDPDEFG
jgi:hypothetical protein